MSQNTFEQLVQIFAKTSIKENIGGCKKLKKYPIFFNFDGKSPLDIAIDAFDFESFNYLLF